MTLLWQWINRTRHRRRLPRYPQTLRYVDCVWIAASGFTILFYKVPLRVQPRNNLLSCNPAPVHHDILISELRHRQPHVCLSTSLFYSLLIFILNRISYHYMNQISVPALSQELLFDHLNLSRTMNYHKYNLNASLFHLEGRLVDKIVSILLDLIMITISWARHIFLCVTVTKILDLVAMKMWLMLYYT